MFRFVFVFFLIIQNFEAKINGVKQLRFNSMIFWKLKLRCFEKFLLEFDRTRLYGRISNSRANIKCQVAIEIFKLATGKFEIGTKWQNTRIIYFVIWSSIIVSTCSKFINSAFNKTCFFKHGIFAKPFFNLIFSANTQHLKSLLRLTSKNAFFS